MAEGPDESPIGFSESDFNRVREVVRYVEASYPPSGNGRNRLPPPLPDGIPIYNDTGSTLGKYSLVRPHAIRLVGKKIFIDVKQPDTTFRQDMFVVGPNDIPSSGYGSAQSGPIVRCLYDSGTPTIGTGYGPKPSQLTASLGYPCCLRVLGIYDATDKIMWARLSPIDHIFGRAQGAIAKDSTSGTVEVYYGAPTTGGSIITSMTITGVHNPWDDVADNAFVGVNWRNGYPCLDAREC